MITDDQKAEFIDLRARGYSFDKISEKLKISKPTLIKLSKEHRFEIHNAREFYKEKLQEVVNQTYIDRLESLVATHKKIADEFSERDMRTIKTEKLYSMYLSSQKVLSETFKEKVQIKQEPEPMSFEPHQEWET